jgi:hypothetical protein
MHIPDEERVLFCELLQRMKILTGLTNGHEYLHLDKIHCAIYTPVCRTERCKHNWYMNGLGFQESRIHECVMRDAPFRNSSNLYRWVLYVTCPLRDHAREFHVITHAFSQTRVTHRLTSSRYLRVTHRVTFSRF